MALFQTDGASGNDSIVAEFWGLDEAEPDDPVRYGKKQKNSLRASKVRLRM